jgi:HD-GYP domain-containing protein (c-di-GMP phosphodiesterase class II)
MDQQRELSLANIEKLKKQQHELFANIAKLAQSADLRDAYTGDHSQRVTSFALLLGRQLRLSPEELEVLRFGTPFHDIGEIKLDAILKKPGPLTPRELDVMKTHTSMGAKILEPVPHLRPALPIVRSHHERWDGQGYPDGLAGKDIPQLARIVAVADAFDAMVFDTPYRRGQSVEVAFAELENQRGRQFDPDVVTALLQIRELIVQEMQRFERR